VLGQYGPVIAGMLLLGGAPLIDQAIAAMLGSGSVAALNYGTRLSVVLVAVGPVAVATAILPHFSKLTVTADWEHVRDSLRSYAKIILAVTLPVIALLMVFSEPLVRLFFERGQFTGTATGVVTTVQRYSLLQIPPAMVMALVLRLVASMKANRLLLRAAALSAGLNLVLDLTLTRWMGIAGIALASGVVQLVALLYLLRLMRTHLPASLNPAPSRVTVSP
jgi:putative peptidoglycan lipid II flippase